MSSFVLHPEVLHDLDDIWEYIAADNLDAAVRVREEIYAAIRALIAFPHQGHSRHDLTPFAISNRAGVCDSVRAR